MFYFRSSATSSEDSASLADPDELSKSRSMSQVCDLSQRSQSITTSSSNGQTEKVQYLLNCYII